MIRVWHFEKHDEATVTEIKLVNMCADEWVRNTVAYGGFWSDQHVFIPWHRVNFVELSY